MTATTTIETSVVVIGAGIAGAWLAYRLAQRGISVLVVSADGEDHTPSVSRQWAASVLHRRLVENLETSIGAVFADVSGTQHPELQSTVRRYFPREYAELSRLVELMPFEFAMIPRHVVPAPRLGAGSEVVATVLERMSALGGRAVSGRVTHLHVVDGSCRGLQFTHDGEIHTVRSEAVVLAAGGFSGLFADAATANTGAVLGMFAGCGGRLANLEFFFRFALGDLTRRRVLYPPDLKGARLYRDGERAVWLETAHERYPREQLDLAVFREYWTRNFGVPHVAELTAGTVELGPIRGFSMGGAAHVRGATNVRGIYSVGEARHDLAADCIVGLPWASYLASAGELCDVLAERGGSSGLCDVPARSVPPPLDLALRDAVRERLAAFQDRRFAERAAASFVTWCREARAALRRAGREDGEDLGLLVLAEAFAASALARRESRGFFFRGDRPDAAPGGARRVTHAVRDPATDRIDAELVEATDLPAM